MRAFSNTTGTEQPAASNRRQPVRQTRTNPARTASSVLQPQGGALAQPPEGGQDANPGFYPAITHFTDAITALPKEMIRHYTMLKEVDAKIYGPEEVLGQLVNRALKTPIPPRNNISPSQKNVSANASFNVPVNGPSPANSAAKESRPQASSQPATQDQPGAAEHNRRILFQDIRAVMAEMIYTLDEKNHVMNTAIDGLEKQLKRCNSSYPHIEDEISEEARYGSLTHWAYTDRAAEKKGMMASERTRRGANNLAAAAALHEAEVVAVRSEARREAVAARKHRNQHLDSDFDDGRTMNKKAHAGGKGRKAADANPVGLGIANGTPPIAPPNKKRKVEKPTVGGLPAEKAMASVFGANGGTLRGSAGSPRDTPGTDLTKKRGRGGAAVNGAGRRRSVRSSCHSDCLLTFYMHRTNTNASTVNSPSLASSPVIGTFAASKDRQCRSPAPALLQRAPSSRARQNSTQSVLNGARNRSTSTNHKAINGNGLHGTTADVDKVSGLTGRTIGDIKTSMKEAVNANGEHLIEDIGHDGASDLRGGLVVGSRNSDRLKKEETENGNGRTRAERPPSISVSTRGGNSKGPSKTATPINATFAEPQRARIPRATEAPLKRSHKKGAGLAAQIAAAAAAHDEEGSSVHGDEDEEDVDEPRYCYCNRISFGEMVGCDGEECEKEWFHLECVGLTRAPAKNGKSSLNGWKLLSSADLLSQMVL